MEIKVFSNYEDLSRAAANLIETVVQERPKSLFCFPAGDTPSRIYEMLSEDSRNGLVSFSASRFIGLDEWIGVPHDNPGNCLRFLTSRLFLPLGIAADRIDFFDSVAADPEIECRRISARMEEVGPVNLMMLGIGMNGHVGLNEPGTRLDDGCRVARLDETTRRIMRKYFVSESAVEEGYTLGLAQIMQSEKVVLLASGRHKAEIVQKIVDGGIQDSIPASRLHAHHACTLFADREAASGIREGRND
jgi:glucosamine-6-phosphate isomerase